MRTWSYGLTADEWLHLAAEGTESEVAPCCANLSQLRETLNSLAVAQEPYDSWRGLFVRQLLDMLQGDRSYAHEMDNRETFPIYNKLMDAIEKEVSEHGDRRNSEARDGQVSGSGGN